MPRFSIAQIRAMAAIILAGGVLLTVYWVAAGQGLYAIFLALELGEGPSTHPLAAAGLTFLAIMVPATALIMTLAMLSPLRGAFHPQQFKNARHQLRAAMDGKSSNPEQQRAAHAIGIAAGGSVVGAGIRAGWFEAWFGDPGSFTAAASIAAAFGIIAGLVHGRTMLTKIAFSVALVILSLGALPAVGWFLERRPEPLTFELLLPIFIGGLPGGLVFLGVTKWIKP
jgi:hypothetical protein